MKTFNTQVCTTKEQSQRLLALGLKKETADMGWVKQIIGDRYVIAIAEDYSFIDIPAWSLHRLLSIAGDTLDLPIIMFDIGKRMREIGHFYCYEEVIQFIEDAIKEGYLNKEYLEE